VLFPLAVPSAQYVNALLLPAAPLLVSLRAEPGAERDARKSRFLRLDQRIVVPQSGSVHAASLRSGMLFGGLVRDRSPSGCGELGSEQFSSTSALVSQRLVSSGDRCVACSFGLAASPAAYGLMAAFGAPPPNFVPGLGRPWRCSALGGVADTQSRSWAGREHRC